MYVAVKGGEKAIAAAHRLQAERGRGDPAVPEVTLAQIAEQLGLAVDRVMTEGALYDRELAALAIKQAQGRSGRGGVSAARLSHDIAAVSGVAAARHGGDDDRAAHLGDAQGFARRTGARRDV